MNMMHLILSLQLGLLSEYDLLEAHDVKTQEVAEPMKYKNVQGRMWKIDGNGMLIDTRTGTRYIGRFYDDGQIADTRTGTAWVGRIASDGVVWDTRGGSKPLGKFSVGQIVKYFWGLE